MRICKRLGAKPESTIMVGDSDVDMKTAKNAGAMPIGVSWGYRDPDVLREAEASLIAESPEQLFDILLPLVRKK